MKEIIGILTTILLLVSTVAFADSAPSDWAEKEIEGAKNAGIITNSVTENYQENITREQFCELVMKLYESITNTNEIKTNDVFDDTDNEEILKAYQLGIVKGVTDNLFSPNTFITRQEICVMLTRCIDISIESADIHNYNVTQFADIEDISDWALSSVQYAFDNNIIKGVGENKIDPLGNTTCEQAILLTYRIYENNSDQIKKNDIVFRDAAFEYSVRRAIALDLNYEWGTTYDGKLTTELLDEITSLLLYDVPNGKKLTSVSDIDKLANLKAIEFENDINNITDLAVISNSEVEFTGFAFELCVRMSLPNGYPNNDCVIYIGKISNEMLQKITGLSTRYLPDNIKLKSLKDLVYTPNIDSLSLYSQNIELNDFSEIGNLKNLKNLSLPAIKIKDDSFLYDINVEEAILFPLMPMYLYLDDEFNYQDALKVYETIKQKIQFIESKLNNVETTYDKYKIIHDYLVENMEYDYDFVENSDKNGNFVYMSLYEGKGVCNDYAYTYQYLCEYFGLDCWLVFGDAKGIVYEDDTPSWGLGHAWNIVKIDDGYYHVDVTWDDPVGADILRYDYFLVSDDTIAVDHKWGGSEYGENMFGSTMEIKIPFCPVDYKHNLSEVDLAEAVDYTQSEDNGDRIIDGIHYNITEIIYAAEEELNIPERESISCVVSIPKFDEELQEYIVWVRFYENDEEMASASWCIESKQFYTRFSEFENY